MNKLLFSLLVISLAGFVSVNAQQPRDTSWKKEYRETSALINNLLHTKLEAKFDFTKSWMYGKVWITLKPHFYPTDSLRLDAKGMDIKKVALVKGLNMKTLKYEYDGRELLITLDKTYKNNEPYTIYIDYTAKPDEADVEGSAAISDAKGLYFINPQGKEKDKPTQIWTQGETEATSVWCPTIDKPNQKTTQEMYLTVPDKFVTLSNGLLLNKKKNADGTRTDYWKMDLPHAPYLFFIGVGDFAIIKDSYKGKEVSYYVDKEYASVARKIFGQTPEMMAFFSKITGVDYPWSKYAQITGHDYVSGAMENTTATLHSDAAQQDARELIDGNRWESVIAHELFHHWFGDYVTTESWSNITLNESFANYSETLWFEYKNGKDAGDAHNYSDMQGYLQSNSANKDLVRFYYHNKEDVFDAVSYNKGGRILHMLRNYIGNDAFNKALNLYLNTYKFKATEVQQLRLIFEEVTGRDLNWYWNQWFYGGGHPSLDINYSYDNTAKKVQMIVKQTQSGEKVFRLPVDVDIYFGPDKVRNPIWVKNKVDTFYFIADKKPDLINFDGEKMLLCTKKENKTIDDYIHQYKYAGNFVDRREAIDFVSKNQDDPKAIELLKISLNDKFDGLRNFTIGKLELKKEKLKIAVEPVLIDLAINDPDRPVRANAITKLGQYKKIEFAPVYKAALSDSSYSVSGFALEALSEIDSVTALLEAKRLSSQTVKGKLSSAITSILIKSGDETSADMILSSFEKMPLSQAKFNMLQSIGDFLGKTRNIEIVKRGIDAIVSFRDAIPEAFRGQTDPFINGMLLKSLLTKKTSAGLADQADYIKSKLPEEDKKGF